MNCREAQQLISPYLDGMLEGKEALQVQLHLEGCEHCRSDYQDLVQLSCWLRCMGKDILPAPAGLKDAVMATIQQQADRSGTVASLSGWLNRSWKTMVPAAAAAVLLLFTALNGFTSNSPAPPPVAVHEPEGEPSDPAYSPAPADNHDNDAVIKTAPEDIPPATGTQPPDSPLEVAASDPPGNTSTLQASSAPVLLSAENRNILSTMLVIRLSEEQDAIFERVQAIASPYGVSAERLGQQVKEGISYNLFKLAVNRGQEQALINSLSTLGTVLSRSDDKQDISQAYTQALEQFLSLSAQRSETSDPARLKQLDQQIAELQQQLGDWKQKAGVVTVVLWIQN